MPKIAYYTRNFTTLCPPASGDMTVSQTALAMAAAGMGATPVSLGGYTRPMLELGWRVLMALANIEPNSSGTRWKKSSAYARLDRSEKTAVSYFLGMTQACLAADLVLGFTQLIHLDAVLALLGKRTNTSRPDLVCYDPATQTAMLAVEAKGRTNGRQNVADDAKTQALKLPSAVASASAVHVGSVGSFEDLDHWESYLIDPPAQPDGPLDRLLTPPVLLTAYYRPLVAAMRDSGSTIDEELTDDETAIAHLAPLDLWLGLPWSIVNTVVQGPLVGPLEQSLVADIGTRLAQIVKELPGSSIARLRSLEPDGQHAAGVKVGERTPPAINDGREVGDDGMVLILGDSWNQRNRT